MTKDWVHGVGHSPVCQILSQIVVRAMLHPLHLLGPVLLGCCRLQLASLSSTIVLQPPLLCEGWGGYPLCLLGDSSVMFSTGLVTVQLRAVFCPSAQCLSFFCEAFRHFPERSWARVCQVFHELVCPLTDFLPQIFFNLTTQ